MTDETKEYYKEEINKTYDKISLVIRSFDYFEYADLSEEISEEFDKACLKLFESQNNLLNALNMIKRS